MFVLLRLCGRGVRFASSGSSVCCIRVARFVRVPSVCSDYAMGWYTFVGVGIQVRFGGGWVRSGSYGSSWCALGVVEFIPVRLVRPDVQWGR